MESIITGISNMSSEGVVIELNQPTKLKGGNIESKSFFLSWDKIGEELFENYCTSSDVAVRDELRHAEVK